MFVLLLMSMGVYAQNDYILQKPEKNSFPLVSKHKPAPLYVSSDDYPGVLKVAEQLQLDIEKVTGVKGPLKNDAINGDFVVIIGTVGKNPLIDKLIADKKINAKEVVGKWDSYAIQTVTKPLPGVKQALVIFGSNKRGSIYGMYDLSAQIGVSPWYWWADAPIQTKEELFVKDGYYSPGEPKVKYRGIFLNDEAPALTNWAKENFGGYNHKFYEKVFELILRLKGNYIWPAMWPPTSFFDADPENVRLADEMGIVVSTSHHEPMMRAHNDWYKYGKGKWNYEQNKEVLQKFWRNGFKNNIPYENVVTMGMRGDGDEAMSEETAVGLLQKIISDQRKIIEEETGKPASERQQVWAIYKEVQDYYDKGMRVDDDITILFCDDNWGNIQILPKKKDLDRKGGFGMYYHFDYVGGPVSYKWLNVTQIEKVWEQMNLAYQWGVKDLWIVNVGDLKPMELPISFWMDYAWNPEAISHNDLPKYYTKWASQQFGQEHAKKIGEILSLYTKYNGRRTPESITPETYSLVNYREADRVVEEYKNLMVRTQDIYDALPEAHKAAFYQLVYYPVAACSNLYDMIVAAGKNKLYADQGRISANDYANKVEELFARDRELSRIYHEDIKEGKWNHMMAQPHIDFTNKESKWNDHRLNKMPPVSKVHPATAPYLRYVVEGDKSRRAEYLKIFGRTLPFFDPLNDQRYYIEFANDSDVPLDYKIETQDNWIKLSSTNGKVEKDLKVFVSIDWDNVPKGTAKGRLKITGTGRTRSVEVPIKTELPTCKGFIENNGVVSFEADHFEKAVNSKKVSWITIPNLGRTSSAVTIEPANIDSQELNKKSPYLEYTFTVFDSTDIKLNTYLSPTLNFKKDEGLKFAVSIDDEVPVIVNMNENEEKPLWHYADWWQKIVLDHVRVKTTKHANLAPGVHTLKVWMIDPGVVFQKFVIDAGGLKPSYLGPEESKYIE